MVFPTNAPDATLADVRTQRVPRLCHARSKAVHEVQFPFNVSQDARSGPRRKTQIVALTNGDQGRNASWLNARREYDVTYAARNADWLAAVVAYFEPRNGMLDGFRFKDWSNTKSCLPLGTLAGTDRPPGVTDGVTSVFQLVKTCVSDVGSYSRGIAKPVADSVLVTSTVRTGAEVVVDWNKRVQSTWSNIGQTGASIRATLAGFLSADEVGQTGPCLRLKLSAAARTPGTKYRVQGWFKAGTGTQMLPNLRCQPGKLDCAISGAYASPAITSTAGGAVSNVVSMSLGGGTWPWSMDVFTGSGFTAALVGIGNPKSAQSVIKVGVSLRPPAVSCPASGWSVDPTSGFARFSALPVAGGTLTAGFQFDTPLRFDTDMIDVALNFERLRSIQSSPLIEVRKRAFSPCRSRPV